MPSTFSRTFRSLESESEGRSRAVLLGAALVLGAWTSWFTLARLSVYVASDTAQLEVMRATHPIDAPVGGRVIEMNVALDQEVHAGDVLVVLDSETERLELAEARAKAEGIEPQLEATRDTLAAEERALGDLSQQSHSAIDEGKARIREAQAAAKLADSEAERLEGLRAKGSVSEIEAIRARANADQRDAQLAALQADTSKLQHEFHTNRDDRRTRLATLQGEASRLDAELAALEANIDRIQHDIERRSIRAMADGKLGEVGAVRMGSVLKEGDRIATIVAPGNLRVVAQLPPASALGRVKEGQLARVRLEGFPWTEFGDVTAQVTQVASEVRDNHARVELTILKHSELIPLQHGMPATAEIEIEKASPAQLVLRAAGQLVAKARSEPAPGLATVAPGAR
ncbi:MAG: HlyD family secretion protein [Polyangiaceae bacterium]